MVGLAKRERALYERIIEEKERTIIALASEVDWHRAQSGTYLGPSRPAPQPVAEEDEALAALEQVIASASIGDPNASHLSEDEEEILWNLRNGGLSPAAAQTALAQINGGDELDFDPE